jgi:hypothetical protein
VGLVWLLRPDFELDSDPPIAGFYATQTRLASGARRLFLCESTMDFSLQLDLHLEQTNYYTKPQNRNATAAASVAIKT